MTKRTIVLNISILATAELETDEQGTNIALRDIRDAVIGRVESPLDGGHTSEEYRTESAKHVSRLALQYLLDRLDGKHAEPEPVVTQQGALA